MSPGVKWVCLLIHTPFAGFTLQTLNAKMHSNNDTLILMSVDTPTDCANQDKQKSKPKHGCTLIIRSHSDEKITTPAF